MNVFRKIGQLLKRGYDAAIGDRFTATWFTPSSSKDGEIRQSLVTLRNKARDLFNNDDYARRYVNLMLQNVIGPNGINLQIKTSEYIGGKEVPDSKADQSIELSWKLWTRADNCTPNRRDSFKKVEDIAFQHLLKDGEIFARIVENSGIGSHSFNIELIEPDLIDEKYNAKLENGNVVVMGVELNQWREPQAYYFKAIPIELTVFGYGYDSTGKRIRIPASDIIHHFSKERAQQTRGISWFAPVVNGLHRLNKYEKAALINAEIGASKMGFFVSNALGASYKGDNKNKLSMKIEPGSFQQLPEGLDFKSFDSKFPDNQHDSFTKSHLRRLSAGFNVSYHSLSCDITGVNFSSIRAGLLEEREYYKSVQTSFIEGFLNPIFERWLKWSLSQGLINHIDTGSALPASKYDKFNAAVWTGRRWPWIDPQADTQANLLAVAAGLKSRGMIASEEGKDLEDIFIELNKENQLMQKYGLTLTTSINQPQQPANNNNGEKDNADNKAA